MSICFRESPIVSWLAVVLSMKANHMIEKRLSNSLSITVPIVSAVGTDMTITDSLATVSHLADHGQDYYHEFVEPAAPVR